MENVSGFQIASLVVFATALVHVFSASRLEVLAHRFPSQAGLLHLLGEVEVVFGFWAMVLFCIHSVLEGGSEAVRRVESLDFTEPLFVFVAMVVAGSRPVVQAARSLVQGVSSILPLPGSIPAAFAILGVAPLLGSFITEPAAMTVAALLMRERLMPDGSSARMRYAALAVLFVNISIGGVLTSYAAPPVLMVAAKWGWNTTFMATTFGWRAVLVVLINAILFIVVFRRELSEMKPLKFPRDGMVPTALVVAHLAFLAAIVASSHHRILFMAVFMLFLGFVQAYRQHHSELLLKQSLLVAFFLAGLVVLGSPQGWWLGPIVESMGDRTLFFGTTALTAIVDNAALTYLGSLVKDPSSSFQYFLVAGAVAGGGLTVIANAPNPAGASILRDRLPDGVLAPSKLLLAAIVPTAIAIGVFLL